MELLNIMLKRRSVRAYTKEAVKENDLKTILQAGLLSPTGRNKKPWEFIVVKEREVLEKLSVCRTGGAGMLKDAAAAIVVIGDEGQTAVLPCPICI